MKNRCSGYSSDSEKNKQKEDLSVLRKPIYTALSGFLEAKKAYENGTEEIRRLLARECDIIYECNECRNIFRSLTNFISHKRVYCRNLQNHFANNNFNFQHKVFIDQDVSTIIQAEQDYVKKCETGNKEAANKDLSSIIERLLQREQANRLMNLTDFYEQVNNKLTQDEVLKKKHTLQLDNVPNSSVAVYQTIKNNDSDNIRAEVNELDELLHNDCTTLGPDGKILQKNATNTDQMNFASYLSSETNTSALAGTSTKTNNNNSTENTCSICHINFTTEKTLKMHIKAKHIASTYVYQCPSCSQAFLQPAAVNRHLFTEHNKTNRKIRLMRDSILKRRVRADEVQIKGPSRELARLQTDKEKKAADNKAWLDNVEGGNDNPMCTFCGKTFDRKAVLTTHLNTCPLKDKASIMVMKKSSQTPISAKQSDDATALPEPTKLGSNSTDSFANDEFSAQLNLNDDSSESAEPKKSEITTNRRKRRKAPTKSIVKNEDIDSDTLNEMFMNLGKETDSLTLKTVSLENFSKTRSEDEKNSDSDPTNDDKDPNLMEKEVDGESDEIIEKVNEESVAAVVKSRPKKSGKLNPKILSCFCKICEKKFDALSNLRRHISMFHYRSRKFGCQMCDYRAFRRYDVINHLNAAHLITGERETVIKYVATHEEKICRDDIDGDIVVISPNGVQETTLRSVEKRSRRSRHSTTPPKPVVPPTAVPSVKAECESSVIFTEPTSFNTPKLTSTLLTQKPVLHEPKLTRGRPIRNRVKPVNKDFLYDLSNILKKDMQYVDKESVIRKRRSTNSVDEISSAELITPPNGISTEYALFANGAALKMAKQAISCGRAKYGTYNELLLDQSPRKTIVSINSDNDEPEAKNEFNCYGVKPSQSEHSIIQKYSKRRRIDLSGRARTPIPLLTKSTISTLFNRVDMNMNGDSKSPPTDDYHMDLANDDTKKTQQNKYPLEKDFENFLITSKIKTSIVNPNTSSASSNTNSGGGGGGGGGKRITLLQRLKDNNNKKIKDSLLRSALEH